MVEQSASPIEGEARLKIEGGLAHFPGLAREHVIRFCDLPASTVSSLIRSADEACFFEQPDQQISPKPDARTYVVDLTVGGRSHRARLSEPIQSPALAEFVAALRQLVR